MIGKIVGDFEIVRELGRGGMGSVFEARDRMLGRRVAVKVVHPELGRDPVLIERFRKEAQALARLNHPNVISVYSLFRAADQYFLVMEYVEGQTLEARLRTEGALPWKESVDLLAGALEGLQHVHEQGILHRDLKPANLFLPAMGGIKVMDFGIAHILGQQRLTRMGTVVGTLAYMSPEQVGGGEIDVRSDIYSMGIVLYEMVTGRVPFQGKSEIELMLAQLQTPPPPPRTFAPSTPEWLEEQILRALAKDPRERHHMAAELAADLRHGLERGVAEETGPTRVLSVPPAAGAPEATAQAASTPPPVAPLDTGTRTLGRRGLQLVPMVTAALLVVAAVVVVFALLPSASGPEPTAEPTLGPPADSAPALREPPRQSSPPASQPAAPPPQVKPASPVPTAPVETSPPPPAVKTSAPPPPPPPVSTPPPPPPAVETYSAPASPARPVPDNPNEAFRQIGEIARRMPPVSEQLTDHFDEYLDALEDTDESRLKAEDWVLESRFDELLEATERLRGAYNVAAVREGRSGKRGLRKLVHRVRATWSAADRGIVSQRIEELRRERETIDGLMRQANSDELTRKLWRQIRNDILHLERVKGHLR